MDKEISKILESSLNAAKKIPQYILNIFSRFRSKKITVETEVKGAEEIEGVSRAVETLPKTKTVEVKVEKISVNRELKRRERRKRNKTEERAQNDMTRNLKENIPVISDQNMGFRVYRILRSLRIIPFRFAFYEGIKFLVKIGAHFYNS